MGRIPTYWLLAIILVTLGLAVNRQPDVDVPVTGEQKTLTDAWVQNAGERVLSAAVEKPVAAVSPQRMDLGAGYTLVLEGLHSRIEELARATLPMRATASAPTRMDIGSGYSLLQQGGDWTITC